MFRFWLASAHLTKYAPEYFASDTSEQVEQVNAGSKIHS
jgi:hypothetical protein